MELGQMLAAGVALATAVSGCGVGSTAKRPSPVTSPERVHADVGGGADAPQAIEGPNPVRARGGGVQNVSFYYDGKITLAGTPRAELADRLGRPAIVVTTPKDDEVGTVKAIHSIGAKAYRYLQFYWAPNNADYEGINLVRHPGWAFCGRGDKRSLGRITPGPVKWYFIDANERAVRKKLRKILAGLKSDGWDGVFFDRGEAATQYAADIKGRPIWSRKSTCTGAPHKRGARFADSYVNMLGLAHAVGLKAMMNTGKSPFDPVIPMRPQPADRDCRNGTWSKCNFISDAWRHLDLVLNEAAAKPRIDGWARTFVGNQRSERDTTYGQRTVALITTSSLGGARQQTRRNVFYLWSRIKLFDLAVAVNTGDDRCEGSTDPNAICNRYGVYPQLVNTKFGRPLANSPSSTECLRRSEVRCVWKRLYAKGANVLNAQPSPSKVSVKLGTRGCRHVYNVFERRPLAGNNCVRKVSVKLPAWSGRPLKYSKDPW